MDIAIASDNNYISHAATLICSICENNKKKITIHLLDGGIKEKELQKLLNLSKAYSFLNIVRYDMGEENIRERLGVDITKDRSLSAYARIFIPEIVDPEIERILYLDADGIVCSSLEELFQMDMKGFPIAGVNDSINPQKRLGIGFELEENYINSGVLLWDLKKSRELNLVKHFKKFIFERHGDVIGMDQGTINSVLKGNVLLIHPRWNTITPFFQLTSEQIKKMYKLQCYYSQDELDEAISNPSFIHFVPNYTSRPWIEKSRHPYQSEYLNYRNKTDFKLINLEIDTRKNKQKIIEILFHYLPFPVFNLMINKLRR